MRIRAYISAALAAAVGLAVPPTERARAAPPALGFERATDGVHATSLPVKVSHSADAAVGKGCVRVEWTEPIAKWSGLRLDVPTVPAGADGIAVYLRAEAGQVGYANLKLNAKGIYLAPLVIPDRWCRFVVPFDRLVPWGKAGAFDPKAIERLAIKPDGCTIPFYVDDLRFVRVAEARRAAAAAAVRIAVDAARPAGRWDHAWSGIGEDPLRTYEPALRKIVADANCFRYRRSHNTFTDAVAPWERGGRPFGGRIYSEDETGKPRYDWTLLDAYLDECVALGQTPIIETSFMPEALAEGSTRLLAGAKNGETAVRVAQVDHLPPAGRAFVAGDAFQYASVRRRGEVTELAGIPASGTRSLRGGPYPRGSVVVTAGRNYGGGVLAPPKDYRKWHDLIRATARHCVDRYGLDRVRTWYWEIWNEPDLWWLYWRGVDDPDRKGRKVYDLKTMLKMYDYMSAAIKGVDGRLKVGGPGIAGWTDFLDGLVLHATKGTNACTGKVGAPLDFVSWHAYASLSKQAMRLFGIVGIARRRGVFGRVEFQLNEYGYLAPPNGYNRYAAVNLVKLVDVLTALRVRGRIPKTVVCFWGLESSGSSGFDATKKYVHGFLVRYGERRIKKPIWNGYAALARLGRTRLAVGGCRTGEPVAAMASIDRKKRRVAVIVYHHDDYAPDDQQTDPQRPSRDVSLTVENVPFARAAVTHYRIDANHSSAFDEWKRLGRPVRDSVTDEMAARLDAADELARFEPDRTAAVHGGRLSLRTSLPLNSLSLYVIRAK